MRLSSKDHLRVDELIEICKKHQGEYIPGDHGSGSWATTYSNQFIEASAEMYAIFERSGSDWPVLTLSQYLKSAGIRSCRGSIMNIDKVDYLYITHLKSKVEKYK